MVKLDFDRINRNSPYKVFQVGENGCVFRTDFGIHYGLLFDADIMLQCSESYQFSIINYDNTPSPRDNKLRDTIITVIREFFESNQATMLYLCETADGKQEMRDRLFTHWLKTFADESDFVYRHAEVMAEGIMNYMTMLLRKDNPDAVQILEEWSMSLHVLSEKP